MKFTAILLTALLPLILVAGKAHADDLIDKINILITYFNGQNKHYTDVATTSSHSRSEYRSIIREASQRYSLDHNLIESIIRVESNFNPMAVSSKGAMGLMQLMPETAREIGVTQPFDPHQNIMGGAYYYRLMLERFGDHRKALHAYNCGPKCVNNGRTPGETKRYANSVIREYKNLKRKEKYNVK